MPRSVVLRGTRRCPRCHLPPRWCVCVALQVAHSELAVAVLAHSEELHKPSSTGLLVRRVLPQTRIVAFDHRATPSAAEVVDATRTVWVLHPSGKPPPSPLPAASALQLVLLDGSWQQASKLLRHARTWGRVTALALPDSGRYWLRTRQDGVRGSTAEALAHVLDAFGEGAAAATLRLQLELHVAAFLLSRGKRNEALRYLSTSPAAAAFPDTLARLTASRGARGGAAQG